MGPGQARTERHTEPYHLYEIVFLVPRVVAQALRSLRAQVGAGPIIALAPQTIDMQNPTTSYFKLALDIQDILTVVNTQFSGGTAECGGAGPRVPTAWSGDEAEVAQESAVADEGGPQDPKPLR